MSIIKELTASLKDLVKEAGYEVENLNLQPSGRKDLGQFQINDAMPLAKKYGKNPRMIAEDIAKLLEQDNRFTNINIAGPGFINITLTDEYLSELMNTISNDLNSNIDKEQLELMDKQLQVMIQYEDILFNRILKIMEK